MKTPLPYYGGKTNISGAIARHFPAHEHYVEPFAGSLAVLLAKPRSRMETVNDLDQDLMTFWRVLRDDPDGLAAVMALTPHSRTEHDLAYDLSSSMTDLERARRVWVMLSQGRGSTIRRTGWRFYRDAAGSSYGMPDYLSAYMRRVPPAAARLHGVSLECRDALELVEDYGRDADTLLYCDPPYLRTARNSTNYRHELASERHHRDLADALKGCRASVVLSGYSSPLYDSLYAGWDRVEIRAWTGNGIRDGATKTDGDRVEVLWSNRNISEPNLFDEAAS